MGKNMVSQSSTILKNMEAKNKNLEEENKNVVEKLKSQNTSQVQEIKQLNKQLEETKVSCSSNCKGKAEASKYMSELLSLQSKMKNIQATRASEIDSLDTGAKKLESKNKQLSSTLKQTTKQLDEAKSACLTKC